jgi:hypothetical protein
MLKYILFEFRFEISTQKFVVTFRTSYIIVYEKDALEQLLRDNSNNSISPLYRKGIYLNKDFKFLMINKHIKVY